MSNWGKVAYDFHSAESHGYQKADGSDFIRYDNERGKGDHRHIGKMEEPYQFVSVKKLAQDFYAAIGQSRKTGGIS